VRLLSLELSLLLAACAAPATPAPTPTQPPPTAIPAREPPTAVPTSAPASGDAAWSKIQQAGKIVVGRAADYPPFEYCTPDVKLDGFDIDLMQAIGQK
jgi:ABC-type amino acid transport substrate-binding protein